MAMPILIPRFIPAGDVLFETRASKPSSPDV